MKSKEIEVEKLGETLKKNGAIYNLVKRSETIAIYSLEYKGQPISFEVFKITIQKPTTLVDQKSGKVYDYARKEIFPGNRDFGKTAWAVSNIKSANKLFKELTNE